jgi:hypothetical protein
VDLVVVLERLPDVDTTLHAATSTDLQDRGTQEGKDSNSQHKVDLQHIRDVGRSPAALSKACSMLVCRQLAHFRNESAEPQQLAL